jgi:hypothetical protein
MRTSGGRGYEGWIIAIPVIALLVATSSKSGGVAGLLYDLNSALRQCGAVVVDFVRHAF